MSYLGNQPATDTTDADEPSNVRVYDVMSSNILKELFSPVAGDTITYNDNRFIQGQRVTYNDGGGTAISGLSNGVYYIIKNDKNTIKLAASAADAVNNIAVPISGLGVGTSHTLNVAFDGINTRFTASYNDGTKAQMTRAAQLQLSINGVIQQPQDTTTPANGFGIDLGSVIIFSVAPVVTDAFWGNLVANNFPTFDIADNDVDSFTGDGTTTDFTLSKIPVNSQNILVTIDGVVQYPSDNQNTRAYGLSSNVLEFTTAPPNNSDIQVRHIGFAGATTSEVTGFYGRTGNVVITDTDPVVAIQSGGVSIGTVRTLNFVGTGNTFAVNGNTIDVSIRGGGGGTGAGFSTSNSGLHTTSSIGVNTTALSDGLVGAGNSFQGVYISNGMMIMDNTLNGNHYIEQHSMV